MPQPTRKHGQQRQISGTSLQNHQHNWKNCQRCPLHTVRKSVVLIRGTVPCKVLFIGETPGESEDVLGVPFMGPAGKLLNQIIESACNKAGRPWFVTQMAFTHLIGCIPKNEDTRRKGTEPLPSEVEACQSRILDLIKISKPKIIVAVGTLSDKYGKKQEWEKYATIEVIHHPSYLMRLDQTRYGLETQRTVVKLTQAFEELD